MRYGYLSLVCMVMLASCGIFRTKNEAVPMNTNSMAGHAGLRYTVDLPRRWGAVDTAMQGLRVLLIIGPAPLDGDKPRANIITVGMDGRNPDDFTQANKRYLEQHDESVVLETQGRIKVRRKEAIWFTYTRVQDGIKRDMINYIVPSGNFACMITCSANAGSMGRYRAVFDKMVRSLRIK